MRVRAEIHTFAKRDIGVWPSQLPDDITGNVVHFEGGAHVLSRQEVLVGFGVDIKRVRGEVVSNQTGVCA